MSAQSEPENYSIDEMMDRLKNRSRHESTKTGDEQLITRPDGTQVIRVRKRKRRSQQPHKSEATTRLRSRILQASASLILLLLAVLGSGIAIVFANSSLFRENLIKNISTLTDASVDMRQFRMNPTTANASSISFNWQKDNPLDSLMINGVTAEISPVSFLGKSMIGREAAAMEGTLTLKVPLSAQKPDKSAALDDNPLIRFDNYTIPKFNVLIGDTQPTKIRLMDSEANLTIQTPSGRPQLLLNRGNISIVGWPNLRMDRSHIEFLGQTADIISLRLKHESDPHGFLELRGTVPASTPDSNPTLSVHMESFPIDAILGPELGHLVSGRIDTLPSATSDSLVITPGSSPALSFTAVFRNSVAVPFEISDFLFLSHLAQTLDDQWFKRPVFSSEVRGTIHRDDQSTTLDELYFLTKGRMVIQGKIAMAPNGSLSGKLDVGIAEGMIKISRNARLEALFSPVQDGFRHIILNIGGSVRAPIDNFKEQYNALPENPEAKSAPPSFEDLTRPK